MNAADHDPDIVCVILRECQGAGLASDIAQAIERRIRALYGGLRVRIPKRKKQLTQEQRARAYADGLGPMPTGEVLRKHGISRSTLYRLMKTGPP